MFNLRNLYTPKCIIISSKDKYCYAQFRPSTLLSQFIFCYWASPSNLQNKYSDLKSPQNEPIIPDGCIDIVFTIDKKTTACFCNIFGPMDRPYMINLGFDKFQIFGITFYPGGLHPFLRSSLKEFKNKIYKLEDVMHSRWRELCLEIALANSISDMVNASNSYFSSLLNIHSTNDSLSNILYKLYKSKGNVTVKELSQSEIISERQISRICNDWLGINLKTFSRIVRFQNIINSTFYSTKVDWTSIALEYGYYDESHFFNEFKEFYGAAPGEYLKNI